MQTSDSFELPLPTTPVPYSAASLEESRLQLPLQLHAGATTRLIVKFRPTHAGMTKDVLTLTFKAVHEMTPQSLLQKFMGSVSQMDPPRISLFSIGRSLEARCGYAHLLDALKQS